MLSMLKGCCSCIPQRWIFVFMGFLAMVNVLAMRVCLSITITEMVVPREESDLHDDTCPTSDNVVNNATNSHQPQVTGHLYDWDEYTQGVILSSFYWGYVVTHLPGGILAEKFGGKHSLGLGMLSTAIFTLVTPIAVQWGEATALIVLRILMGFGEGITLPALNMMLSKWTPPDERSKAGSLVYIGGPLGAVFATAVSGLILANSPMGWPAVFYFFGGVGVLWYLFWSVLCFNTPQEHPFISDKEAKYLRDCLSEHAHEKPPPVPWKHVVKSKPLWALIAVQIGHDWAFYTMATDLPKFMRSVLHFSVETNGYLSSMPYIGMWVFCVIMSWIADWLIANKHMSITNVRKLGTTIASIGPGLFIVGAVYVGCDSTIVVVMLTSGITLLGSALPSLKVNALDLSPNYSGTVMAITNAFAACSGIATPYLVGVLTPQQLLSQWRLVFWIILIILIVTNGIYLLFASGEVEPWNDPKLLEEQIEEKRRAKHEKQQVEFKV